ncbi:MAG: hypothetical protein AAF724_22030 [Pseudomonadota bacterium]
MIETLTRRLILVSLIFVLIAGAAAIAVVEEDAPGRAWVAGQAVPCVEPYSDACKASHDR